ncbi:MAG: hypothetical protein LBC97_04055 [Bifidobacteriaceae bacterium]|nr:hypothetical protein [Bifidobacteriaceae bacterium]
MITVIVVPVVALFLLIGLLNDLSDGELGNQPTANDQPGSNEGTEAQKNDPLTWCALASRPIVVEDIAFSCDALTVVVNSAAEPDGKFVVDVRLSFSSGKDTEAAVARFEDGHFVVDGTRLEIGEVLAFRTNVALVSVAGQGKAPSSIELVVGDQTMLLREG